MIQWADIEKELGRLRKVSGGYSQAVRGLITLSSGQEVFVKQGLHDNTKKWARKEVASYRLLEKHHYPHAPRLVAVNDDETAFAIEALTAADGWDWQDNWDSDRLAATLRAMDDLAKLDLDAEEQTFFSQDRIGHAENGWQEFTKNTDQQAVLLEKLDGIGQQQLAASLDFPAETRRSLTYHFADDTLVHFDIRADNCAWNKRLGQVKAVDWNWTVIGDKDLEMAATLTHVYKSGFRLPAELVATLNPDALHWMAGFWFNAAVRPIWPGGPEHLRDMQLESAVIALELAARVPEKANVDGR